MATLRSLCRLNQVMPLLMNQQKLCINVENVPVRFSKFMTIHRQSLQMHTIARIPKLTSLEGSLSALKKTRRTQIYANSRRWTNQDNTQPKSETISGKLFSKKDTVSEPVDSAALACRLANENGYLSWCRNAYLITGVGVGMLYKGQTQIAELAGYSAILLSGVSVSWGTAIFIYNLFYLRKRVQMSTWFVCLQSFSALAHAVIYLAILIIFSVESDKTLKKDGKQSKMVIDD